MPGRASTYRRVPQEDDVPAISRAPHSAYALLDCSDGSWSPETLRGLLTDSGAWEPSADLDAVSHIEDELVKKRPPQFFLAIIFYASRSPGPYEQAEAVLRVALPPLHASQRCLYALADDTPCLRGGRLSTERSKAQDKYLGDLTGGWSSLAQGEPLGVVERTARGRVHVTTADASSVSKWNIRRKRCLAPPWKPLSESPSQVERPLDAADALPATSKFPWPSQSNRQTAVDAVAQFVQADTSTSRYLVCPESAFGWDLDLLQDLINDSLESQATGSSSSRLGSFLASFGPNSAFRSAQIQIESKQPAAAIRAIEGTWRRNLLGRSFKMYTDGFIVCAFIGGILWVCLMIGLFTIKALAINVLAVVLSLLPVALAFALFPMCEDRGTVHEGIGVTWALSRWSQTPFAADDEGLEPISKDDVLARLPGAVDARVQDKSWYVLYGNSEEDWWAQNAVIILNALRSGRRGALFLDEMPRGLGQQGHQGHEHRSQSQAVASSSREDPLGLPPMYSHNLHTRSDDRRDDKHQASDDDIV
ncbi:hypothetical protein FA10DRAFT_263396 [Acaromyces ingoldii]|uniref:Uncharacterized protein n=1 Tax=Acaromyces ingoldii TaxID=215250 RepID=A0A316YXT5_9BASI|nr:hypothetical protein FA10DRAFT_263396 [Acaromyces ingoldii]PWN92625.1 hypothetical protein FA10DRAFT_263396 [Acaromyces ingoldii]